MANYTYKKQVNLDFEEAVEKTKQELQKQGFGILSEIDVKQKIKEKLNLDFPDYKILGACNPKYAHQALELEKELGVFLPCNVIVFEDNSKTFVSAILPTVQLGKVGNKDLDIIAKQVEQLLKTAIDNI